MSNEARLILVDEEGSVELSIAPGRNLLESLRSPPALAATSRLGGVRIESPCGGKGRCGKCRVRAVGDLTPPDEQEKRLLSAAEFEEGWRLACMARIAEPPERTASIRVEFAVRGAAAILTEGPAIDIVPDPPSRRVLVRLEAPRLDEQLADEERLFRALATVVGATTVGATTVGATTVAMDSGRLSSVPTHLSLDALRALSTAARSDELSVLISGDRVIDISVAKGKASASFGIGVDIGTTTIACYLIDLDSGAVVGTRSALNEQRAFGADVISRIAAAMERADGLAELHRLIGRQVTDLSLALLREAGVDVRDLLSLVFAGNTTMMHLLAGVGPGAIAASPFPPVFTASRSFNAPLLGLDLPETCSAWLLPGISAYVGADIVSGIAALGMAESESLSLLLDIGTNGEIAFGGSEGILCCATAAGPAFEGAGIEMGMGGVAGAIDAVWLDGENISYSTLGNIPPRGLCGSGVLDALATFLDTGLIDDSGRIIDPEEAALLSAPLAVLRSEGPKGPRLAIGGGVYLSQGDVRSLQLATAAIAAGIEILLARAGKSHSEVDHVYLAGGFGSFLDLRSALRVGLIPAALGDRVVVVGNSSGAGAVAACLSRARLSACENARKRCSYIELSSSPEFNELFVDHMFFPVTS